MGSSISTGLFNGLNVSKNICNVTAAMPLYNNLPCRPNIVRNRFGVKSECGKTNTKAVGTFSLKNSQIFPSGQLLLLGYPFAALSGCNQGTRYPKCDIHATVEMRTQMVYDAHAYAMKTSFLLTCPAPLTVVSS